MIIIDLKAFQVVLILIIIRNVLLILVPRIACSRELALVQFSSVLSNLMGIKEICHLDKRY